MQIFIPDKFVEAFREKMGAAGFEEYTLDFNSCVPEKEVGRYKKEGVGFD